MRTDFPWYNADLKNAKKLCRKLERLWKKSKLLVQKLAFKKQCAKFNKLPYNSKKNLYSFSIKTCKKDAKKSYQIVGKFLKSCTLNKLHQICPALELPHAFAYFFQNEILTLHQYFSNDVYLLSVLLMRKMWPLMGLLLASLILSLFLM